MDYTNMTNEQISKWLAENDKKTMEEFDVVCAKGRENVDLVSNRLRFTDKLTGRGVAIIHLVICEGREIEDLAKNLWPELPEKRLKQLFLRSMRRINFIVKERSCLIVKCSYDSQ
jgi:hypothetical protein